MNITIANNIGVCGHRYLEFADVHVDRDNRLYIDPARIHLASMNHNPWAVRADEYINDFFDQLFQAACTKDMVKLEELLSHCGEINATRLGLSRGNPCGNGASAEIIRPAISSLVENGFFTTGLVTSLADIPIWCEGLGADRLSDWITNIIWPVLWEFTQEQAQKYGVQIAESAGIPFKWSLEKHEWEDIDQEGVVFLREQYLLCPKEFVHFSLLLSTEGFLRKKVYEYRKRWHLDRCTDLCHMSTRKNGEAVLKAPRIEDLKKYEICGQSHVKYAYEHARENPQLITEYHRYYEYRPENVAFFITDQELDERLYDEERMLRDV